MLYPKHFEVSIRCEGTPLQEFSETVEDSKTISCFVASEAGKTFSIHYKSHMHNDSVVSADCYMDGHPMCCNTVKSGWTVSCTGVRTGLNTLQLFRFAPLAVTDDDELLDREHVKISDLGVIEARIYRVVERSERTSCKPKIVPQYGPIHERSKKAGTHCVSLGSDVQGPVWKSVPKVKYIDKINEPYIRFKFRYRPSDLLKAEGIIPRGLRLHAQDHDRRPSASYSGKRMSEASTSGSGPEPTHTTKRMRTTADHNLVALSMNVNAPEVKREPLAIPLPMLKKESLSYPKLKAVGVPEVIDLTDD